MTEKNYINFGQRNYVKGG